MNNTLKQQINNGCQTIAFVMPDSFMNGYCFLFDFIINSFGLEVGDVYEDFTYKHFLEKLIQNSNSGELIPSPICPNNLTSEHMGRHFPSILFNWNYLWDCTFNTAITFLERFCPGFVLMYQDVKLPSGANLIDFVVNGLWAYLQAGFNEISQGLELNCWNGHNSVFLWHYTEQVIVFINPLKEVYMKTRPVDHRPYLEQYSILTDIENFKQEQAA